MQESERSNYLAMWDGTYGETRGPGDYQRRDDGSHIYPNTDTYYEWWYFDASFTDGRHAVVTFHYRNVFLRPMIPSVQVFIYGPDGTRFERFQPVRPEDTHASPDYCDVRMGPHRIRDTGDGYEVFIRIEGVGLHLHCRNAVPPWKPGTGFNYKDEGRARVAGWVVPMPQAGVEGELYLEGETVPVKGAGYHDHNWGNFPFHEVYRGWYWGRIHQEPFAVDYAWVLPRNEEAPVLAPLLVARPGEILLSTNRLEAELGNIRTEPRFGRPYAGSLRLKGAGCGVSLSADIRIRQVVEGMKLPRVTDWEQHYLRFLADYEMDLEVDGASHRLQGELLQELMWL
jgi:hypothetical protein